MTEHEELIHLSGKLLGAFEAYESLADTDATGEIRRAVWDVYKHYSDTYWSKLTAYMERQNLMVPKDKK